MNRHRTGEAMLNAIETLTKENDALQTKVDFLFDRQATGLTAIVADRILSTVDAWVQDPSTLAVSEEPELFPSLDKALNEGIMAGVASGTVEALQRMPSGEVTDIARTVMDETTFRRVVQIGLIKAITDSPGGILDNLDTGDRLAVLSSLIDDPEVIKLLAAEPAVMLARAGCAPLLQTQYNMYGFFDTDKLPIGARILITARTRNSGDELTIRQNGIVTDFGGDNLILPLKSKSWPFREPFKIGKVLDGRFMQRIYPGTSSSVKAREQNGGYISVTSDSNIIKELLQFSVDGQDIEFEQTA